MNILWHDVAGLIGVGLILLAYFLLQIGRLVALDLAYSILNLVGAALIVLSLIFEFNLAAFVMEIAWVMISLIGIYRVLAAKGGT